MIKLALSKLFSKPVMKKYKLWTKISTKTNSYKIPSRMKNYSKVSNKMHPKPKKHQKYSKTIEH